MAKLVLAIEAVVTLTLLSGCAHQADFDLSVSNLTTQTLEVHVIIETREGSQAKFEQSFSVPPNTTSPNVRVRIPPDEYRIIATTEALRAEEIYGLGTSIVGVGIRVSDHEIIIGVGRF